jgi:hypothetical protein
VIFDGPHQRAETRDRGCVDDRAAALARHDRAGVDQAVIDAVQVDGGGRLPILAANACMCG